MAKQTKDMCLKAAMPKDVKVVWSGLIAVIVACGIVVIGIPAIILLIAFPQLWVVIAALFILLIGGYFHARRN